MLDTERRPSGSALSRTVLVHSVTGDFHSVVASHALRKRGNRVVTWIGDKYPEKSSSSVTFRQGVANAVLKGGGSEISADEVEVVWYRRRRLVSAPPYVDRRDEEFVTEELRIAERSHPEAFSSAFWINSPSSSEFCEVKARQFRRAQIVGLDMPRTLISNDPDTIREFLSNGTECIYKPLGGHVWSEGGSTTKTYTSEVKISDLPVDRILRAAPGIFQDKVPKAFEVRAQFFGKSYFALSIDSTRLRHGDVDWRLDQRSIKRCASVTLPSAVESGCLGLMEQLGIVSGGFDFIVTPDGQWLFMEVNEAGQFFFIESWCPELPVLDAFCQFVESASADFCYSHRANALTLTQATVSAHETGLISK